MKSLHTNHTTDTLAEVKFSDLAAIYNQFANLTDVNPIKKFRDKATGIKRILEIQKAYTPEVKVEPKVSKTTPNVKFADCNVIEPTDKKAKEGSAMAIVQKACVGSDTIGYAIEYFRKNWSSPRSKMEVTYSFARGYVVGGIREGFVIIKE